MLFADLAGYTTLCETRDPEQVHLLVRPLMNALRALCEQRGGVVPSIQGDGFMAVFGARTAHEDDPDLGLDAAVELQRAVAARSSVLPDLPALRVGLHIGEVVVAPSWEDTGIAISGDHVNVASRICGAAAPGEVLASVDAIELIRASTGWSAERELRLRGRDATVSVRSFDWAGVSSLVRGPRWSASTRYVPRPTLEAALRGALVSSRPTVVVGDAGMGKTRLVHEVLKDSHILAVAASAAFRPTAEGLCADLLEQLVEPPHELIQLLRGGASGGLGDETMTLRAAGACLSRGAPDVSVFVDDAELLPAEEAALLSEASSASGLTWVFACREPRPDLATQEIRVPVWSKEEAALLLAETLPRASAELREAVLTRAGDCPLYVEQCAQLLLDNGAVVVDTQGTHVLAPELVREIPSSMRLFVSSRLDLLPDEERAVLGIAAVLGAEPDLALLRHLAGEGGDLVARLVERGLLRWVPGVAGLPGLRFSHALVRDVAYDSQLRTRRVEIHRAAAEWYAVLPVSQVLESQAYHLEAALQLAEPDCDLLRRTVEAMVLYARSIEEERARVSHGVLERARALVEARPECDPDTLGLDLAWASVNVARRNEGEAHQAASRALQLASSRGDSRATAEAHLHLARSTGYADLGQARIHLELAEQAYAELSDVGGVARVEVERGYLAELHEGMTQYIAALARAHALALRSGDPRLQAMCAQQLAMHHAFGTGRLGFERWGANAREVSRRDDVGLQPRLELAEGALAMFELDSEAGRDVALSALAAGRDLGLLHIYGNALVVAADLHLVGGRLAEAGEILAAATPVATGRPTRGLTLQLKLLEARLRQRQGAVSQAQVLLADVAADELAQDRVLRRDLAEARGWIALERGRFGEARALAAEAVAVDDEMGERCAPMRPRLIEVVATVAAGEAVALGTIAALRAQARETGLTTIAQLATRWLYVDELTRGWTVDLHGVEPCDVVECRALDLEIEALSARRWELLHEAADVWAELGTTVWRARALLWHSELTGTPSLQADELLTTLQSPAGLAEILRAQVRGLRE